MARTAVLQSRDCLVESYRMQKCPKCGSDKIHRSRTKTTWEGWRKEITGKGPYRCHACRWRGWAVDTGPKFTDVAREVAERAIASEPPNLKGASMMREHRYPKPVDLHKLDQSVARTQPDSDD